VANIKRVVNFGTGKLNGLKSHDYHIFVEGFMTVMFRGYFKVDDVEVGEGNCLLDGSTRCNIC
jgi:hypothetical protein